MMTYKVKWTETGEYAQGGVLKDGFSTSEQAEQYIQDTFINEPEMEDNILQLVEDVNGEEIIWSEYDISDIRK